jgi:2-keto-4-pentenoate hydratase
MNHASITEAAQLIWANFRDGTQINALPASCRPSSRAEGYAVPAAVTRLSGQASVGWKIAATSAAAQTRINVDGPLAGQLLTDRVFFDGTIKPHAVAAASTAQCPAEPHDCVPAHSGCRALVLTNRRWR